MTEPLRSDGLPEIDSLWNYSHPGSTEAEMLKLLPTAEAAAPAGYVLELLTQVARAQGLQRKFDEAHRTLDRVDRALNDDQPVARLRALLERGRVWNSSGQPAKARPLFLQAWDLGQSTGEDFYAVDAAHMMGIVEAPQDALSWSLRALEKAEASAQVRTKKWLGSLYNNIGWSYHDSGEYEKALEIFRKALRWREEHGELKSIRIGRWAVGRALRSLGRVSEALDAQRLLLEDLDREGARDGYVFEELAECLLLIGKPDEAAVYFRRAHQELSQDTWLAEGEPERLRRLRDLGAGKRAEADN